MHCSSRGALSAVTWHLPVTWVCVPMGGPAAAARAFTPRRGSCSICAHSHCMQASARCSRYSREMEMSSKWRPRRCGVAFVRSRVRTTAAFVLAQAAVRRTSSSLRERSERSVPWLLSGARRRRTARTGTGTGGGCAGTPSGRRESRRRRGARGPARGGDGENDERPRVSRASLEPGGKRGWVPTNVRACPYLLHRGVASERRDRLVQAGDGLGQVVVDGVEPNLEDIGERGGVSPRGSSGRARHVSCVARRPRSARGARRRQGTRAP